MYTMVVFCVVQAFRDNKGSAMATVRNSFSGRYQHWRDAVFAAVRARYFRGKGVLLLVQ